MPRNNWGRHRRRHRRSPSVEECFGNAYRKRHCRHRSHSYSVSPQRPDPLGEAKHSRGAVANQQAHCSGSVQDAESTTRQHPHSLEGREASRINQAGGNHDEVLTRQKRGQPQQSTNPIFPSPRSQLVPPPIAPTFQTTTGLTKEPILETPVPLMPDLRAVEERRRLARPHLPFTASSGDLRNPVLGDPDAGVLGSGAPLLRPLLAPVLAQRPPTPALLPMAGASSSPSPQVPLPPPPKVVPFFYDDYVSWLYATPATSEASAVKSRDGGPLLNTERAAPPAGAPSVQPSAASPPLPSTLSEIQKQASSQLGIAASAQLLEEDIAYDRNFSVSTNWAAVMAAPRIMPSTPSFPSLLASCAPHLQGSDGFRSEFPLSGREQSLAAKMTSEGGGADAAGPATSVKGASERLVRSPVLTEEGCFPSRLREGTSESTAPPMDASPVTSSSLQSRKGNTRDHAVPPALPLAPAHQSAVDPGAEGWQAFMKHFQNGKVHTRPPWFLCSTLLNNCEHPYYIDWLEELELGSVEEELARARAMQRSVLGDQSPSP